MQKKIKIAYIIDELNIGGTENQLVATIELLDKNQFEILLICLRPSQYFSKIALQCEKVVLHVRSLISIDGFLKLLRFVFFLRKHKIDIVQTYFFDANIFGVFAAKFAGVKKIISCRRDMGFWYTTKLLLVLKVVNKLVDRVLVNSNAVKENVCKNEQIPCSKVDTIYNGIDADSYKGKEVVILRKELNIKKNDLVVGIVSNLNRPVKRVDLFVKAAAEVLKKRPNVTFIIVGDGYLREELYQLCKDFGIDDSVIFTGLQEKIASYISLFDIGVLSSDSEGFSNSILEYMASGIPVIATNTGGNKEILKESENGLLVEAGDYMSLCEKILVLLYDESIRMQIGKRAQTFIHTRYDWSIKIKEIESYYCKLFSTKPLGD